MISSKKGRPYFPAECQTLDNQVHEAVKDRTIFIEYVGVKQSRDQQNCPETYSRPISNSNRYSSCCNYVFGLCNLVVWRCVWKTVSKDGTFLFGFIQFTRLTINPFNFSRSHKTTLPEHAIICDDRCGGNEVLDMFVTLI